MKCPNSYQIKIKGSVGRMQEVPCGGCEICRKAKALEWSVRLLHELKARGDVGMFVTLTYDDENVRRRGLYETLCKEDLVKYIKRLRNEDLEFKYYCVGEYGEKYGRPHYHCLFFGLDVRNGDNVKIVKEKWKYGIVDVGIVEVKSIHYCVGYIRKKLIGGYERDRYRYKDPPFSISSQGLGLEWIKNNRKYLDSNNCINMGGYKASVPRYYVKKKIVEKNTLEQIRNDLDEEHHEEYLEYVRKAPRDKIFYDDFLRFKDSQNAQKNKNIEWKNKNLRRNAL